MSAALELLIRRFARQTRVGGRLALSSNGDPALVAAFEELGWSDPYPIEPETIEAPFEATTIEAPERAVLETPEGHVA